MNNENIKVINVTSRNDKHYVVLVEWVDGVKKWKQPEKANLCLDTGVAYARSVEWGLIARKWANDNGIGRITVKLDPLRDPNAPKRKAGRKSKRGRSRKSAKDFYGKLPNERIEKISMSSAPGMARR